tara:strand:- start:99 stop:368 length:270 start_codon:yes stop_codon:yes gene_type:complete
MKIEELDNMKFFTKEISEKNTLQVVTHLGCVWVKNINASARVSMGGSLLGKCFDTWEEAVNNYKNKKMKSFILTVQDHENSIIKEKMNF